MTNFKEYQVNFKKNIKMIVTIAILLMLTGGGYLFLEQKQFGALPSGERLARIQHSPNYKDGQFQNLSPTPDLAPDVSYWYILKQYMSKPDGTEPSQTIPSVKIDLKSIQTDKPVVVWFGHSSYFIKIKGKNILVDPVFSGQASPVSFFGKNYKGSNVYNVADFPELDLVLITHDHYDHLDYKTIMQLKDKTKVFYTSLGVGAHLEYWGINANNIKEFDWWQSENLSDSIRITATPARHFSGRKFKRNQSLWASYVLETSDYKLFLGGDSGYDTHFKTIGQRFGSFDLVLLECGQYNTSWPYIHMMPEEVAQAANDLNAKVLMPVHWAKFTLALHPWNEPVKRLLKKTISMNIKTITPQIGEKVILNEVYPDKIWWE